MKNSEIPSFKMYFIKPEWIPSVLNFCPLRNFPFQYWWKTIFPKNFKILADHQRYELKKLISFFFLLFFWLKSAGFKLKPATSDMKRYYSFHPVELTNNQRSINCNSTHLLDHQNVLNFYGSVNRKYSQHS